MQRFIVVFASLLLSLSTPALFAGGNIVFEKATYSGTIGGGSPDEQGSFTIKTTATGAYSAKGRIGGRTGSHKGQFSATGGVDETFTIKPLPFVTVPVHLIMQIEGEKISGTVQIAGDQPVAFTVYQVFKYTPASPAPQAGRFTGLFTKKSGDSPGGKGVAMLTVSKTGKVKVVGTLPDGSKISTGGGLSPSGIFPIANILYSKKGALAGFAQFHGNDLADTVVGGTDTGLTWAKSGDFSGVENLVVHRYTPPAPGSRVLASLDASNGAATFSLSGGGLAQTLNEGVTVSTANKVSITDGTSDEGLKLTIDVKTGLVTGILTLSGGDAKSPVNMVVDQATGQISGFFSGSSGAGDASITPAP